MPKVIQLVNGGTGKKPEDCESLEPLLLIMSLHFLSLTLTATVLWGFSQSAALPPPKGNSPSVSSALFLEPEQLLSRDSTRPVTANAQKSESQNCSLTIQRTEVSSQRGRRGARKAQLLTTAGHNYQETLHGSGEPWLRPLAGP